MHVSLLGILATLHGLEPWYSAPKADVLPTGRQGNMAVGVGFEPTEPLPRPACFQDKCDQPDSANPLII